MRLPNHKEANQPLSTVQPNNERWWTENPMTYDWAGGIREVPLSPQWFKEVDAEFIQASKPYTTAVESFDLIMPADLAGKRVLEIGCGMGLHTSELVRRGGSVTAIDLTEFAVEATSERLANRTSPPKSIGPTQRRCPSPMMSSTLFGRGGSSTIRPARRGLFARSLKYCDPRERRE